jgi:hypothetical protein
MHPDDPFFERPFEGAEWSAHERGGEEAGAGGRTIDSQCVAFCPICRTADVIRATMPAEFQDHWHAWQREMLLAVRSLLDHYIEHVEAERRRRAVPVEDIPIE